MSLWSALVVSFPVAGPHDRLLKISSRGRRPCVVLVAYPFRAVYSGSAGSSTMGVPLM